MNLKILLVVHAIVTLAAGIVLIVAPAAIPGAVDIHIDRQAYLLSYFLGAAELSMAYLSFYARKIADRHTLQIIVITFIVFHAATGILELYALFSGVPFKILTNILLRAVVIVLFYYYGIRKIR